MKRDQRTLLFMESGEELEVAREVSDRIHEEPGSEEE